MSSAVSAVIWPHTSSRTGMPLHPDREPGDVVIVEPLPRQTTVEDRLHLLHPDGGELTVGRTRDQRDDLAEDLVCSALHPGTSRLRHRREAVDQRLPVRQDLLPGSDGLDHSEVMVGRLVRDAVRRESRLVRPVALAVGADRDDQRDRRELPLERREQVPRDLLLLRHRQEDRALCPLATQVAHHDLGELLDILGLRDVDPQPEAEPAAGPTGRDRDQRLLGPEAEKRGQAC